MGWCLGEEVRLDQAGEETGASVALGCGREDTGKAWKQSGGNAKNNVVVRLDWVALGVEAYEVRKTCVCCPCEKKKKCSECRQTKCLSECQWCFFFYKVTFSCWLGGAATTTRALSRRRGVTGTVAQREPLSLAWNRIVGLARLRDAVRILRRLPARSLSSRGQEHEFARETRTKLGEIATCSGRCWIEDRLCGLAKRVVWEGGGANEMVDRLLRCVVVALIGRCGQKQDGCCWKGKDEEPSQVTERVS